MASLLTTYASVSWKGVAWSFFASHPEVRGVLRFLIHNRKMPPEELAQKYLTLSIAGIATQGLTEQIKLIQPGVQVCASSAELICLVHTAESQLKKIEDIAEDMLVVYHNKPWKAIEGTTEGEDGLKYTTDKRIELVLDGLINFTLESVALFISLLDITAFLKNPADKGYIQNIPQNFGQIYEAVQKFDAPTSLKILGYGQEQFASAKEDLSGVYKKLQKLQERVAQVKEKVETIVGKKNTENIAHIVTTVASAFLKSLKMQFVLPKPNANKS